ncbi:Hypothetical protein A7982_06342 [Minicystis rosea]|nr:Hypothetical protein A7982_06342 [Minicystis rosea]
MGAGRVPSTGACVEAGGAVCASGQRDGPQPITIESIADATAIRGRRMSIAFIIESTSDVRCWAST